MTDVMQNMLQRRSTRAYTAQSPSKEQLDLIMQAAIFAPSAMGQQNWHFIVINNPEKVQKLASLVGSATGREGYNLYNAPAIILVAAPRDGKNSMPDCSAAVQNILLAAHDIGLGSCWINQFRDVWDDDATAAYLAEMGLPEGYTVYTASLIGHIAKQTPEKPRKADTISYID